MHLLLLPFDVYKKLRSTTTLIFCKLHTDYTYDSAATPTIAGRGRDALQKVGVKTATHTKPTWKTESSRLHYYRNQNINTSFKFKKRLRTDDVSPDEGGRAQSPVNTARESRKTWF